MATHYKNKSNPAVHNVNSSVTTSLLQQNFYFCTSYPMFKSEIWNKFTAFTFEHFLKFQQKTKN